MLDGADGWRWLEEQPVEKKKKNKGKNNNNNSCLFLYHFFQLSLGLPKWQVVDDDDARRAGYKNHRFAEPTLFWNAKKERGEYLKKKKELQVEEGFKENENE